MVVHLVQLECHLLSCPGMAALGLRKGRRKLLNPALPPCAEQFWGRNNSEWGQLGLLLLPNTSCFETEYRHLKQGCPPPHADHLHLLLYVAGTLYHLICEKWVVRPSAVLSPA